MKATKQYIRQHLAPIYGTREADAMMRIILESIMHYSTVDLLIHADDEISPFTRQRIENVVSRLECHEPIQYVFGEAFFGGHRFKVTPNTLIPRPETEQLVDIILDENHATDLRVLDIGTGSGCIAISLALGLRFADVTGIDISQAALKVAAENAKALKASVRFEQCDILHQEPTGQFEIIVSNPPYICNEEQTSMAANVVDYEPREALFVPDSNPLLFYRAIAGYAIHALVDGGRLYFEINSRFGNEIADLLGRMGFTDIDITKDMYNRTRFARAIKTKSR
ncbi:MAG: peptide chain release factor N(5)-glutamine methyltransferase [Muribaculaceae bacterium]